MTSKPFIVFALPRSRTAWLSHYLGAGGQYQVGHDIGIDCNRPEDFLTAYQAGMVGTVETGAVIAWRLIREAMPNIKMICIRRPIGEVQASLARFGITADDELMERNAILDSLERVPGIDTVDFNSLRSWQCCKWLFEHCHGVSWSPDWYNACAQVNIQIDMGKRLIELATRYDSMLALRTEIMKRSSELVTCRSLN